MSVDKCFHEKEGDHHCALSGQLCAAYAFISLTEEQEANGEEVKLEFDNGRYVRCFGYSQSKPGQTFYDAVKEERARNKQINWAREAGQINADIAKLRGS